MSSPGRPRKHFGPRVAFSIDVSVEEREKLGEFCDKHNITLTDAFSCMVQSLDDSLVSHNLKQKERIAELEDQIKARDQYISVLEKQIEPKYEKAEEMPPVVPRSDRSKELAWLKENEEIVERIIAGYDTPLEAIDELRAASGLRISYRDLKNAQLATEVLL